MLLLKLLDHDLHRSRKGTEAVPLLLETPARPGFVPAVVSSSRGGFIVAKRLTKDGRLRSGVFQYDSDRLDAVISDLMSVAYGLSVDEKWPNVFRGKGAAAAAFTHVQNASGTSTQPHACLVPDSWDDRALRAFLGKGLDSGVYRKVCRIHRSGVSMPVFCSRPDFVGMYTQFVGGKSSVVLHNVMLGLAFCPS